MPHYYSINLIFGCDYTYINTVSFFLAEVVEYVGLGLELASIGCIVPQAQVELLDLFDSQPALQHLDALHEVVAVVLKVAALLGLLQVLELSDALELGEVLLALLEHQFVQLVFFLELVGVELVGVDARVEGREDVHVEDRLEVGVVLVFEDEVDQHPELLVAPLSAPRLDLLPAGPHPAVLLLDLPEDEDGVVGGQSEQQVGEVVDPAEVLALDLSALLEVAVGQQLELRVAPEVLPALVDELEHPEQLAEDDGPDLLVAHQPVEVDVEDVAVDGVLLDLVGLGLGRDAVDAVLEVRRADLPHDALEDLHCEGGQLRVVRFVYAVQEGLGERQQVVQRGFCAAQVGHYRGDLDSD